MLERTDKTVTAAFCNARRECGVVNITVDASVPGVTMPQSVVKFLGRYVLLNLNRPNGANDLAVTEVGVSETLHFTPEGWTVVQIPWAAVCSIRGSHDEEEMQVYWLRTDKGTFEENVELTEALRHEPAPILPAPRKTVSFVWTLNGARKLTIYDGGRQTTPRKYPELKVLQGGAHNDDPGTDSGAGGGNAA